MTLDPSLLFLSLITSGAGFVLFVYGKKQDRWPQLVGGLAFMVYPYFVTTLMMTIVIAVAIVVGMWIAVRQGW
jgi:hypothetical protein